MSRGVGVIGAGPGAWALHIPTVARLPELFRVIAVTDGGSGRAREVAANAAAWYATGVSELLADPDVEVVAICSPPGRHAEHIRAAVAAGVRGILCEKPIATDAAEAAEVVELCRSAGVALVVGSHHLYDPAWQRTKHHLLEVGGELQRVEVVMSLPPNGRYHQAVSDRTQPPAGRPPAPDWSDPAQAADALHRLISGLLVHDLPLLRDLAGGVPVIDFATPIRPIGVALGWHVGDIVMHSSAVLHGPGGQRGGADALWRLVIVTSLDRIEIEFPPSFVHAGSARVRVRSRGGVETVYPAEALDGYDGEWRALAAMLDGEEPVEYHEVLADVEYALALAEAGAALVGATSQREGAE